MTRILHIADMHLDSAFTSRLESEKAQLRRSEQREVFSKIINIARESADVMIIAGDLFESESVSDETIRFLKRKFADIAEVPVFIAAGNHDPYTASSVYAKENLGGNVHIFSTEGEYYDIDRLKLRICGASFGSDDGSNMPALAQLSRHDSYTNIAVIHGDTAGGSADGKYNPLKLADIEASGFDYVALGHIHASGGIHKNGNVYWAYPGIPEPRGFDEGAERGEYGVIRVEVHDKILEFEHIDIHCRLYHTINICLDENMKDSERIIELIADCLSSYSDRDLFKIILTGRISADFVPNMELISDRIKELAFFVRVKNETETVIDLTADENDNSLRAEYIRMLNEKVERASNDDEKRIARMALDIGVSAIDGRL